MLSLLIKDIRHRWIEYLAGMLVIALGISILFVQQSVTSSANKRVHDLAHNFGKNMLVLPAQTDISDFYQLRYGNETMPDNYAEKLRSSSLGRDIKSVQSRLYGNVEINDSQIVLIGEKAFRVHGEAIVDRDTASQLHVSPGDTVDINGTTIRVTRVVPSLSRGRDTGMITSLATAQRILDRPGKINSMRLGGCWCRTDVASLASDVQKMLPGTKTYTLAGMLKAQSGVISVMARYSSVIHVMVIILIVGIVVLLILSQVRRERREIGLLLAIGVSPHSIRFFFMAKAALVVVVGIILGCLLSFPLTKVFSSRFLSAPIMPALDSLQTPILGLYLMVGVLSAYILAHYVSTRDPIEALREE